MPVLSMKLLSQAILLLLILTGGIAHAKAVSTKTRNVQSGLTSEMRLQRPKLIERPFGLNGEIFGRGGMYSINLEYSPNKELTTGIGFSYQSVKYAVAVLEVMAFPVYANWYPVQMWSEHRPFISAGVTVLKTTSRIDDLNLGASVGSEEVNVMIKGMEVANATLPVSNLGLGYEYLSRRGSFARLQIIGLYLEKIQVTAGLSLGFRF